MGCIQSGTPINIVRLTYKNKTPTARLLPNHEILPLMKKPLLRSAGVLSGLFYENVVITEGESDRAFYQEINDRLLQVGTGRGIPDCLFLIAQGKHTIKTIVEPLRSLGIPAAAIVDIDVLKDGGQNWSGFLASGFIPKIERNSLEVTRKSLKHEFCKTDKDMKLDGGIDILPQEHQETLRNLYEQLSSYGLFIVLKGEVESWLTDLDVSRNKSKWLAETFEKMGEDPQSEDYLKPAQDDVWQFIDSIADWFKNTDRKGIPS